MESDKLVSLIERENMELEARKIAFLQDFLKLENEETLRALENLLREQKALAYEKKLKPMTQEQYSEEIDQALRDSRNGRMSKASDLKEKIEKWG